MKNLISERLKNLHVLNRHTEILVVIVELLDFPDYTQFLEI